MKAAAARLCYVDTNILISRITPERISISMADQFRHGSDKGFTFLTSVLAELEVTRFLHRLYFPNSTAQDFIDQKQDAFAGIELIQINSKTLKQAARFPYPHLGSLDSIHLATAHMIGATHMLTNDKQLIQACDQLGIATTF